MFAAVVFSFSVFSVSSVVVAVFEVIGLRLRLAGSEERVKDRPAGARKIAALL
jgi:hypothetical protein